MVCLLFELRNRETAADSRAYTPVMYVNESLNQTISKSTAIALGHSGVPAVGNNTVASRLLEAGTSILWISTNVTKDVDLDCSGTIV